MTSVLSLFYLLSRVRHVALGCHHPCSPGDEISFLYLGLTRSKTGNTSCGASRFVLLCAARSAQEPASRTSRGPVFRVRSPEGSNFLGTLVPYALRRFLAINSSRSDFRYFTSFPIFT